MAANNPDLLKVIARPSPGEAPGDERMLFDLSSALVACRKQVRGIE